MQHNPPVLSSPIGQHVVFAGAARSGRLACEVSHSQPAAHEIAALAAEIARLDR